jgi:hypothetical protein
MSEHATTTVRLKNGEVITHTHVGGIQGLAGTPFIAILNEDDAPEPIAIYNMTEVLGILSPQHDRPKALITAPVIAMAVGNRVN